MTTHFDNLAELGHYLLDEDYPHRSLIESVINEAVAQVDTIAKKVEWMSYEDFSKKFDDSIQSKRRYLNMAHSVLDHGNYHLKCFQKEFAILISIVTSAVRPGSYPYRLSGRGWTKKGILRYRDIWTGIAKSAEDGIITPPRRMRHWKRITQGDWDGIETPPPSKRRKREEAEIPPPPPTERYDYIKHFGGSLAAGIRVRGYEFTITREFEKEDIFDKVTPPVPSGYQIQILSSRDHGGDTQIDIDLKKGEVIVKRERFEWDKKSKQYLSMGRYGEEIIPFDDPEYFKKKVEEYRKSLKNVLVEEDDTK